MDLDEEITLVIIFFLFQKISANPIEFVYPMAGISTPEIISPFFLRWHYPSFFFCDNLSMVCGKSIEQEAL